MPRQSIDQVNVPRPLRLDGFEPDVPSAHGRLIPPPGNVLVNTHDAALLEVHATTNVSPGFTPSEWVVSADCVSVTLTAVIEPVFPEISGSSDARQAVVRVGRTVRIKKRSTCAGTKSPSGGPARLRTPT